MKIIEVKNYQAMSQYGAHFIIDKVLANPAVKLGLATGSTPEGVYQNIIDDHRKNGTSYQNVTTFNLDEYIGLEATDHNSYRHYMDNKLFDHIDIPKSQTFVPIGTGKDLRMECERYENQLEKHKGIDLQILGIGSNGHIGFNEPDTSFQAPTHIVDLAQSTREANARFFEHIEDVPKQAITMGIATIMKSKEILLLVSGEAKQEALYQLLHGEVTESFPASILKTHSCVTIIADEKALTKVKVRT
jgi:glucosamine-6-phosphate deaminase